MAAKKVGELIKEARTNAGLTQEQLAKKVDGVSASDISKAERGEKELTQAALKQIAKATGVTQASLINAAKGTSSKTSSSKTSSSKTSSSKTSSSKTSSSKTSSSKTSSSKSSSSKSSQTSVKVTSTEKKLLELYRAADSDTKKAAMSILKGEEPETGDLLSSLLGNAVGMIGNLKK